MIEYFVEHVDEGYYLNCVRKPFEEILEELRGKDLETIGYRGLTIDELVLLQKKVLEGKK